MPPSSQDFSSSTSGNEPSRREHSPLGKDIRNATFSDGLSSSNLPSSENDIQHRSSLPLSDSPSNLADLSGQSIAHYRLERRLGGGAMSTVYLATNQILDQIVALKILMPGADRLTRERFRQEARTVSTLEHPHIVRTLQVGQTAADGISYISMELVDGFSLSALLERFGKLNVADACALLEPIARALVYAHGKGIIHRDVKPSNILLRQVESGIPHSIQLSILDGPIVPLLSDFGISRALDSPELTSIGRTIGTPAYMSPEQCAGSREIDGRADIYSLGSVLYRCLVGRPPYVGTTTQILHAHVYEPLTIPEDVIRGLPALVMQSLQQSLAKEAEHRYPNVGLMAHDLSLISNRNLSERDTPSSLPSALNVTRTMETLSVAEPQPNDLSNQSTLYVLIPGTAPSSPAGGIPTPSSLPSTYQTPASLSGVGHTPLKPRREPRTTSHQGVVPPSGPSKSTSPGKRNVNWIGIALGTILLLLLGFIGIAVFNQVFSLVSRTPIQDQLTPTVQTVQSESREDDPQVGVASTPQTSTETPTNEVTSTEELVEVTATPSAPTEAVPSAVPTEPETEPNLIPETVESLSIGTPTSVISETVEIPISPTPDASAAPAVNIQSAWDDAQFFYADRDWDGALDWLISIQRIDPAFESKRISDMLLTIYAGLANQSLQGNDSSPDSTSLQIREPDAEAAIGYWNKAIEAQPEAEAFTHLRDTMRSYATRSEYNADAQIPIQSALISVADFFVDVSDYCSATEHLVTAIKLAREDAVLERLIEVQEQCPEVNIEAILADFVDQLSGRILYSTIIEGTSKVLVVPIDTGTSSTAEVEDASMPSLQPTGNLLAFRNTRSDMLGIWATDLLAEIDPNAYTYRVAGFAEDGADSPATWNPEGTRLAFASRREGDRRSRIYLVWLGAVEWRHIGFGEEPSWHPFANQLVFRGADLTGNQPGLWLLNVDNSAERRSLTNSNSDSRPVWTPDGQNIVFMSSSRNNNWDIYKVEVEDSIVTRLTSDPAIDGLPTVSPDGDYIAFLSNRDGAWGIWAMPIKGGVAQLLIPIDGQFPDWLEHGVQWVK